MCKLQILRFLLLFRHFQAVKSGKVRSLQLFPGHGWWFLRNPRPDNTLGAAQIAAIFLPLLLKSVRRSVSGLYPARYLVPGIPPGRTSMSASAKSVSANVVSVSMVIP